MRATIPSPSFEYHIGVSLKSSRGSLDLDPTTLFDVVVVFYPPPTVSINGLVTAAAHLEDRDLPPPALYMHSASRFDEEVSVGKSSVAYIEIDIPAPRLAGYGQG